MISLKVMSSQPASVCTASGKGQVLFLVISSQKRERKLGRLVWRVVSRYWRKPEKFRIQFKNSNFMYILKYGILDKVPGVDA